MAKNGILALRLAKRRDSERLQLVCDADAQNSVDDRTSAFLGYDRCIYENLIEEDKFTYVIKTKDPKALTILIERPNQHVMQQTKDAVRDGP